jgi:pimeloyl-ACP methyl ester carboxylesterase
MERHAEGMPPLGRAEDASRQIEQAVRFITSHHGVRRVSIIAHSWGTMATGRFAGRCPELVDRLVLFGPVTVGERQKVGVRCPRPSAVLRVEYLARSID